MKKKYKFNYKGMSEDMQKKERIAQRLEIGKQILYLSKSECQKTGITDETILDIVKDVLIAHSNKAYKMPAKIGVQPFQNVFFHAMPAYVPSKNALGMKWIECYPDNPIKFNLPQTSSLLILNDIQSGYPVAIMDGTWITALRTPAVTLLAAAALHPYAESFGMFGCGVQGIGHVRFAAKTLKKLKKIYIYDISDSAMDNLIKTVQPLVDVEIIKGKNPQELAEKCEVLSSATMLLKENFSIVKDAWIDGGKTILPCDLTSFWDPKIMHRADKYIVDCIETHMQMSKDGYYPAGLPKIAAETGEIIAGKKEGRKNKEELIVCNNIGMSIFDVAVGKEILDIALENKIGNILPL